ncbi:hypothetical protein Syun_025993 [Stephania yunnanensis]|uniref:Uncharacterized protein n=1 Tax=Stephania yunnanensis TaxID=152371 RepID=A0AAP0EZS4_9MAGN
MDMHASLINFETKLLQIQEVQTKIANVTVAMFANATFIKNHFSNNKSGEN